MNYIEQSKMRDRTLDALKCFAIYLVIWGHCLQYLLSSNYWDEPMFRIIYSFHMPLFMTIVGYFAESIYLLSPVRVFSKKITQLILPSVVFSIIYCLIERKYKYVTIGMMLIEDFWFLKTAFACCILYYASTKIFRLNMLVYATALIISLIHIPYLQLMNIMYPCFIFGVILKRNILQIRIYRKYLVFVSCFIFILMLQFLDEEFLHATNRSSWHLIYLKYYRLVIGIIGSLSFILLFYTIPNRIWEGWFGQFVCKYGRYTLGIYILQNYLLEIVMARHISLDGMNFYMLNFVAIPLISIVVLICCALIVENLLKWKVGRFMLGHYDILNYINIARFLRIFNRV